MTKEELKALRKKLGLTQSQMAEKLGISLSGLTKIESGKNNASRQTQMIAESLNSP